MRPIGNWRAALRRSPVLPAGLAVVIGLLVWEVASGLMDARIIFPGPLETLRHLWTAISQPKFWLSLAGTSLRTFLAFGLSAIALPFGLLMGYSSFGEAFFGPYVALLRSTPVISVILLGILWFSPDLVPVFVAILMVIPILVGATVQGVKSQDPRLVEMARVYHWRLFTRIRHISLPSIKPFLQSSSHFALGTAWKAVAAAEVLAQPGLGLGSRMQDARIYLDTATVFALTLSIVLLSVAGDLILKILFKEKTDAKS